jgi:tRNA A-37 threonylcarbamoyl transferase component Bud32
MANTPMKPSQERHFQEVLAAYLQAAEAGQAPDPRELIARHPDLAPALESYFANNKEIRQLARLLPPTAPPRRKGGPAQASHGGHPPRAPRPGGCRDGRRPHATGPARLFGDYEVLEEIARGGMGVVYKARQISLGRIVALKMLRDQELASPADLQRFLTEAEAVVALDHPHIVPLYQVGEVEGQHFFSMRLMEGGSLARHLADYAKGKSAVRLMVQVARAIHFAHQHGILHRDLKPGNILLDAEGRPYVTDFGLAKRAAGDLSLTQSGAILGTPSYMPPEQARAEKGLTTAVDVYGLGAVLYELLTGRPPFGADTPMDTLIQILEKEPARPRDLNRRVDPDLEAICLKCLQKDPQRRYDSAEALAEDLERWLDHKPIRAKRTGLLGRAVKWIRRRPVAAALVALITLGPLLGWGVKTWYAERQVEYAQRQVELYFQHVSQAQDALAVNQRNRADRLLDQCASDLRGWEWYCLKRLCHEEPHSLQDHGWGAGGIKCRLHWNPDSVNTISRAGDGNFYRTTYWHGLLCSPDSKDLGINSDGTQLALFQKGELSLVNHFTGRTIGSVILPQHIGTLVAADFAPGGGTVAVTYSEGTVLLLEVATGQQIGSFQVANSQTFASLLFSPDGKQLAAGSWARDWKAGPEAITVWDVTTGRKIFTVHGASGPMGYSPDSRRLVWASAEGGVRVSDAQTGRQVCALPALTTDHVRGLVVCPDGTLVLEVVNNSKVTVKVYDAAPLDERPPRAAPKPGK